MRAQGHDDGGFSGATMNRPALQQLLSDITRGGQILWSSTRSTD
jgi:DNA invertase Pin-like site-specific DNA recombinase